MKNQQEKEDKLKKRTKKSTKFLWGSVVFIVLVFCILFAIVNHYELHSRGIPIGNSGYTRDFIVR
ncbi:MAG: hypothetical protein FWE02_07280 [Defluviitaleaceae bacterium]|nr:hypothetical protein [Defluviitaleaceae bacterium]